MRKGKKPGRSHGNEDCHIVTWATSCYESKGTNVIWYEDLEIRNQIKKLLQGQNIIIKIVENEVSCTRVRIKTVAG